ncbi:MAG TPA: S8 family serine peptidase [Actinophytocola sp.]|uniref:S8 family serine peptidase n=1 Tax=Actinophytocola sp. TaxID=1872138 RepID=UPI002DBAF447|nr:S8 family serine peptidase [Actinophytocola sp.]HEU5473395.1 S8 family serine peptidase [Actinophytocola sp.]
MLRTRRRLLAGAALGAVLVLAPVAPAQAAAPGESAYLVQLTATLTDAQRAELAKTGARLGGYLPENTYVVGMSDTARRSVERLGFVRSVSEYQPAAKLDAAAALTAFARPAQYLITLLDRDPAGQRTVADRIRRTGGALDVISESGRHLLATLDPGQVAAVTRLPEVLAVGAVSAPETDMSIAREATGANYLETVRGYRGQGVRAEVMDLGLRTTHQEFRARPVLLHGPNSTNTSHGTSTYGQIFAAGVSATRRGVLPEGQGLFATSSRPDRYAHTRELVTPTGPYRAVFQSNSWGSSLTTAYTSISAAMDTIVFDLDILICQSQSNAGTRSSRPQAWAKNVLSVGGQFHRNTLSRTDDAWGGGASIGPAADGRIKPDLSNYYDQIDTTSSTSDTSYTPSFGGTSGATPITCGNAGLLFQMWADGVFDGAPGKGRDVFASRPHAATAKALLVNSATQYPFSGTTHDMTRTHQGWGTVNVRALHDLAAANGWRLPVLVNETDLVTTGQTRRYTVTRNGSQPLKATMVYTDPAGTPGAAVARVNDLTLRVTAPNGTVYFGNNGLNTGVWSTSGGSANTVDTVENVFVQTPAAGTWTIDVIATQINADGHPETAATDADFALVVS